MRGGGMAQGHRPPFVCGPPEPATGPGQRFPTRPPALPVAPAPPVRPPAVRADPVLAAAAAPPVRPVAAAWPPVLAAGACPPALVTTPPAFSPWPRPPTGRPSAR